MNNFVAMEQHICPICGITHQHNTGILLHRKLRSIKEEDTITGTGLCEEHDKLFKEGYIALIVADESKSHVKSNGNINVSDAHRTGELAHLKRTVFDEMFDTTIDENMPMVFIDKDVFKLLQNLKVQL